MKGGERMKPAEKIRINVDCTQIDQTLEKAYRLKDILEEANSLADELASKNILINIDVQD